MLALRPWSVLAGLVAVSLAAVVAFPLFTALYLAPSFSRLIIESARSEAERTAAHLAEQFIDDAGLIRPQQVTPAFRATIARHLASFSLERLNAFAPSGEIVFSDDPAEEGKVNTKPYFREVVAAGRRHASVVRRDGRTLEGRVERFDAVETCVPVVRKGEVAVVLEICCNITSRTAEMNHLRRRSNLFCFSCGGASPLWPLPRDTQCWRRGRDGRADRPG